MFFTSSLTLELHKIRRIVCLTCWALLHGSDNVAWTCDRLLRRSTSQSPNRKQLTLTQDLTTCCKLPSRSTSNRKSPKSPSDCQYLSVYHSLSSIFDSKSPVRHLPGLSPMNVPGVPTDWVEQWAPAAASASRAWRQHCQWMVMVTPCLSDGIWWISGGLVRFSMVFYGFLWFSVVFCGFATSSPHENPCASHQESCRTRPRHPTAGHSVVLLQSVVDQQWMDWSQPGGKVMQLQRG